MRGRISTMIFMLMSLLLGIAIEQGQSQSIPEDVAELKQTVARLQQLVDGAGLTTTGREQIAVFNRQRQALVIIGRAPRNQNAGYVAVGRGTVGEYGDAGVELYGYDPGNPKGFIVVNGNRVHDYAEVFELATREGVRAGAVMAYDAGAHGLVPAAVANARQVIGVVSGAGGFRPGMVIGSRSDGSRDFPISMSGVVYVWVSDEAGVVEAGDLLVPSSVPGVGMRAAEPSASVGRVFGKALEPSSRDGEDLVLMLVMNR